MGKVIAPPLSLMDNDDERTANRYSKSSINTELALFCTFFSRLASREKRLKTDFGSNGDLEMS